MLCDIHYHMINTTQPSCGRLYPYNGHSYTYYMVCSFRAVLNDSIQHIQRRVKSSFHVINRSKKRDKRIVYAKVHLLACGRPYNVCI